jgi:hypothetical protein
MGIIERWNAALWNEQDTDRDVYVRAIRPKDPVVACLITGGTNSNAGSPPTLLFRTSHSCLDPADMDTGLSRDAPFFIEVLVKWIIPMLVPVLVLLQPKGFLRISIKSGRDLLRASFDEKMLEKHPKAIYLNKSEVGHVPLRVVHASGMTC